MNKVLAIIIICSIFCSCRKQNTGKRSIEIIVSKDEQDSIFQNLMKVADNLIVDKERGDSLAFLILPVQASCPSCRKKTIDSIIKYENNLRAHHYIIIAANAGRKTMEGYFRERKGKLPIGENEVLLDSTNWCYRLSLCSDKPTMYYAYNRGVYKRVLAIPVTVRDDLREFFSGFRN